MKGDITATRYYEGNKLVGLVVKYGRHAEDMPYVFSVSSGSLTRYIMAGSKLEKIKSKTAEYETLVQNLLKMKENALEMKYPSLDVIDITEKKFEPEEILAKPSESIENYI